MKNFFIFVIVIIYSQHLFSQDTVYLKKEAQKIIYTDRQPQAVFAELFGKSFGISVNYDSRFSNQVDGWGFSVGIGATSADNNEYNTTNTNSTVYSIPISINYLKGRNGKYLEMGAGITYFNGTVVDIDDVYSGGSSIIGTLTIGYRNQPIKGGFMFRAGFNPIISNNGFFPFYPYVSFGYDF